MTDQPGGLVNVGPVSGLFDVGVVSNLIHIGADGGQFPEQGGVGVGRPGAKLYAHHQLAEHRLHFQAGGIGQLFQVGILGGVQPQGDSFMGVDGGVLLSAHSPIFRPAVGNTSRHGLAGFPRVPIFGVPSLQALIDGLFKCGGIGDALGYLPQLFVQQFTKDNVLLAVLLKTQITPFTEAAFPCRRTEIKYGLGFYHDSAVPGSSDKKHTRIKRFTGLDLSPWGKGRFSHIIHAPKINIKLR